MKNNWIIFGLKRAKSLSKDKEIILNKDEIYYIKKYRNDYGVKHILNKDEGGIHYGNRW